MYLSLQQSILLALMKELFEKKKRKKKKKKKSAGLAELNQRGPEQ